MYLSRLILNPLNKFVYNDLVNFYELHRTLLCAFPEGKDIKPSILFRTDVDRKTGVPTVLVQSLTPPDWTSLNNKNGYLLRPPEVKTFDPIFREGHFFRFRLRACPTKRVFKHPDGSRAGYIKGLYKPNEQIDWLKRKGEKNGFEIHSTLTIPEGNIEGKKDKNKITIYCVTFEGILKVTDSDVFKKALINGIGRGKRFGFGMLSIAPL
ncbi:MAG: type I-E CRISPR-associated protein Cas6/Cse3/CasE [bacterium]